MCLMLSDRIFFFVVTVVATNWINWALIRGKCEVECGCFPFPKECPLESIMKEAGLRIE